MAANMPASAKPGKMPIGDFAEAFIRLDSLYADAFRAHHCFPMG